MKLFSTLPLAVSAALLVTPVLSQTTLHYEDFEGTTSWTLSQRHAEISSDLPPPATGHPSGARGLRLLDSTLTTAQVAWTYGASPVIDLTGTTEPSLSFWMVWNHETGCQWDAARLSIVRTSNQETVWDECLSGDSGNRSRWHHIQRALDPSWGEIQIWLSYDPIDFWNFSDYGCAFDDVRVFEGATGSSTLCEPVPMADGAPGPRLRTTGSVSSASTDLRIIGAGFVPNTFAAGFIGIDTALLPAGRGLRCIGGPNSRRLLVAPTRDFGTPYWTLVTDDPSYGWMFQPGDSVFVQAYYRDGASFNFSEALRLSLVN